MRTVAPLHLTGYLYTVALNIKDPETERLAAEVAALTSETKTGAIRVALQERKERLAVQASRRSRSGRLRRFLAEAFLGQQTGQQFEPLARQRR